MEWDWAVYSILVVMSVCWFLWAKHEKDKKQSSSRNLKKHPVIGHLLAFIANAHRFEEWITDLITTSATHTITLEVVGGMKFVATANPANTQHILKTKFHNYPKGEKFRHSLEDFLGKGILNADGDYWKLQRKIASHEFNTKSFRYFMGIAVHLEIKERLMPVLSHVTEKDTFIDLQDVLRRFSFDNICKVAFGIDEKYLDISFPDFPFTQAFDIAAAIVSARFKEPVALWKVKKFLNIGSEKKLKDSVFLTNRFVDDIINSRKTEIKQGIYINKEDLLSRFLSLGNSWFKEPCDEILRDIMISFILAGRDTISSALTWLFWLLSSNSIAETNIREEINQVRNKRQHKDCYDIFSYDEVKDMNYLHAALCESMRLYPPVPFDSKTAMSDDVLPDGTVVKKDYLVVYSPYAMGRCESIWGKDCLEFRPERWLKAQEDGSCVFVAESQFKFAAFQAGPRICLGKEMAFIQMKCVVANVLGSFRFVVSPHFSPEKSFSITLGMNSAFPIKVVRV